MHERECGMMDLSFLHADPAGTITGNPFVMQQKRSSFSRRRLTLRIKYSRGKKRRLTTVNNFSEEKQHVDYQFPLIYSVNRC